MTHLLINESEIIELSRVSSRLDPKKSVSSRVKRQAYLRGREQARTKEDQLEVEEGPAHLSLPNRDSISANVAVQEQVQGTRAK